MKPNKSLTIIRYIDGKDSDESGKILVNLLRNSDLEGDDTSNFLHKERTGKEIVLFLSLSPVDNIC